MRKKRLVRGALFGAGAVGTRGTEFPYLCALGPHRAAFYALFRAQAQTVLPPAEQLQINLGQQFGIEQGAVERPSRKVYIVTAAQRIEIGRRAGNFLRAILSVSTTRLSGISPCPTC